jgi:hypothetical protein
VAKKFPYTGQILFAVRLPQRQLQRDDAFACQFPTVLRFQHPIGSNLIASAIYSAILTAGSFVLAQFMSGNPIARTFAEEPERTSAGSRSRESISKRGLARPSLLEQLAIGRGRSTRDQSKKVFTTEVGCWDLRMGNLFTRSKTVAGSAADEVSWSLL